MTDVTAQQSRLRGSLDHYLRARTAELQLGTKVLIAGYVGVNLGLILWSHERPGPHNWDWLLWTRLGNAPYDATLGPLTFAWSPVAAAILGGIVWVGYWPWFAAHFAVLWFLRRWPLVVLLTLTSWALYADATQGNAFVFVFVSGFLALRSKGWALVYLALLFLMPRPVQVPLAVYLLWKRPDLRLPTLGIFAVHLALSLPLLGKWAGAMTSFHSVVFDMGPTAFVGNWWFLVGLPLGAWLTWKGQVGWAGLAVSPYVLPQYLLMPMVRDDAAPR